MENNKTISLGVDEEKKQEELKKAEEAKRKEELKKAEEAKRQEELKKAEEAKRQEELKKAEEAKRQEELKKAEESQSEQKELKSIEVPYTVRILNSLNVRKEPAITSEILDVLRDTNKKVTIVSEELGVSDVKTKEQDIWGELDFGGFVLLKYTEVV